MRLLFLRWNYLGSTEDFHKIFGKTVEPCGLGMGMGEDGDGWVRRVRMGWLGSGFNRVFIIFYVKIQ